ncbi:MAG: alpha/beta fold hydrolase [Alphaproteobacteria bacterium]|nr:alpha/beta fold hydrolase [Alphaproteobacteria bacterium]
MIGRRAVLGGAALLGAPSTCVRPARAQYFPQGIHDVPLRFAGAEGVMLAGTLTLPWIAEIRRVPGVVLVSGSGPTDRDGNNPLIPARVDLLKEIAEALGNAGIATLRYDKRGLGQSTASPASVDEQKRFFTWEHFVADVQAAHVELLRHDEIKAYATALLGHSEGGLLALAATVKMGARRPYGLVLASTPGRPLDQIVRAQIARRAPELSAAAERIMTAIRETGEVPADGPAAARTIFPAYAGAFLRSAFAFDPAEALGETDVPCLLLQGAADTQVVAMEDVQPLVDALGKRRAPGEALVAPEVSHNLKRITGPDDPGFAGPLAPAIASRLTAWLGHLLGA